MVPDDFLPVENSPGYFTDVLAIGVFSDLQEAIVKPLGHPDAKDLLQLFL